VTDEEKPDSLEIDLEDMRRLGYLAVDALVEHLAGLEEKPVWRMQSREEGERRLREPIPETGRPFEEILARLQSDVLPYRAHVGHPRFMAFVPGSPAFPSVLADILTAGFNPFVGTWLGGSGPAMVELVAIDWLRQMVGLPEGAGGLFTSGGSAAALVAFVAARQARFGGPTEKATVYASDQTHSCVERAALIAGLPKENFRRIPADSSFRLDMKALSAAVDLDARAGREPFLVVGNAGTTNTGVVDPLPEIGRFCRDRGLWFHVDGAYGGFASLTTEGRALLDGIEAADSWILDPHKWLYQTFECGSVILRRPEELRSAFRVMPDYMQDVDMGGERVNFADYSHQLSRSWRALKVWLSLQYFGLAPYRKAVQKCLDLARVAESAIQAAPDMEMLAPASLGIVCFRLTREGLGEEDIERMNQRAQERLNASGYALLSSTRLSGRYSLRLCILSHGTTADDVRGVLSALREHARA